ncbi:MAG TPA: hypothetical protein VFM05_15240 [Candidatus Saccharimonadales bacterium]|nr:hypothetical protein [Candidatus Saccharimonadales bacterium]
MSERLGHATVTLTLDIYSHVLPSMQKAASEKLDSVLQEKLARHQHTKNQKQPEGCSQSVESVVARDEIEPPTRGFSD